MSISNEMDVQTNVVRPDNGREEAHGTDAHRYGDGPHPRTPSAGTERHGRVTPSYAMSACAGEPSCWAIITHLRVGLPRVQGQK